MRSSASALLNMLLVASCSVPAPASRTLGVADSMIGTWRVVQFVQYTRNDTSAIYPFGLAPKGYLVYDATGHAFFQVVRPAAMDSLREGMSNGAHANALLSLTAGFAAYFGTYVVDTVERTVTHRFEAELPLIRGNFEVATPFRFVGDTLIVGRDSVRVWRLVRVR